MRGATEGEFSKEKEDSIFGFTMSVMGKEASLDGLGKISMKTSSALTFTV